MDQEAFPKKVIFEQGLKKVQVNEEKGISSRGNNEWKSVSMVKEQQRDRYDHDRREGQRKTEQGGPDPIEPCRTLQYLGFSLCVESIKDFK